VLSSTEIKTFLANEGLTLAIQGPQPFGAYMATEMKRAQQLVKSAGLDKQAQ